MSTLDLDETQKIHWVPTCFLRDETGRSRLPDKIASQASPSVHGRPEPLALPKVPVLNLVGKTATSAHFL